MPSDEQVDALARTILDRPHYRALRPDPDDPVRVLLSMLRAWRDALLALRDTNPPLYWALLVGLSVMCVAIIAHFVWTVRALFRGPGRAPTLPEQARGRDFGVEAQQLADQGAHLEAAHRLLLATLKQLAQQKTIILRSEDTNRVVCEKLTQSALPAPLRGRLTALIVETEHLWFGAGVVSSQIGDALYRRWQAVRAELAKADLP